MSLYAVPFLLSHAKSAATFGILLTLNTSGWLPLMWQVSCQQAPLAMGKLDDELLWQCQAPASHATFSSRGPLPWRPAFDVPLSMRDLLKDAAANGTREVGGAEAYSHLAVWVSDIDRLRLSPCTGSSPISYTLVEHPCLCPEQCQGPGVLYLWLKLPAVPDGRQLACAVRLQWDHRGLNEPCIVGSR